MINVLPTQLIKSCMFNIQANVKSIKIQIMNILLNDNKQKQAHT